METYGFGTVATSLRTSVSASHNRWAGMMSTPDGHVVSRTYDITPIVDRVGGGDSFAGGLVVGLLHGAPAPDCVEFAAAASCPEHSIPGDMGLPNEAAVLALVYGDGSVRARPGSSPAVVPPAAWPPGGTAARAGPLPCPATAPCSTAAW